MNTLAKRITLFALVVSLLVSVCVFALPQQEAHAAGTPTATQQQVWKETFAKFKWADTGLEEWNGVVAGVQPANGTGTAADPYLVSNANELRWCLVNQKNCKLVADIDLGGKSSKNWNSISINQPMTFDGDGHTIYNLYSQGSTAGIFGLIGAANNASFVTKNVNMEGAFIKCDATGGYDHYVASFISKFNAGSVDNCVVRNVYVNAGEGTMNGASGLFAPDNSGGTGITITNTHAINVNVYGGGCVSGFIEGPWGRAASLTMENCSATDGVVISTGGHSGGFTSCVEVTGTASYKNCFINDDVYGNVQTGVFVGVTHAGTHIFNNCYAAGKIEGINTIGGFFGCPSGSAREEFNNCYSTSMVGMSNGGTYMGGFAGTAAASSYFTNCYAAGEVGTLKSDIDGMPLDDNGGRLTNQYVTGFVGNDGGTKTNCYYDQQTTGMCDLGITTGVQGLLTKRLFGLDKLGNEWVTSAGGYPELKVFAQSDNAHIRACSTASVCTVLLWADEKSYDEAVAANNKSQKLDAYDTVRKIRYVFPLTNNENSNKSNFDIKWEVYLGDSRYNNISPLVDGDVPIITLSDVGSKDNVSSVAPGIGWLQVNATDDATGDTGMRRLRLVPTTAIALASFGNLSLGDLDTVCSNIDADLSSKWEGIDEDLFTQKHKPIGEFQDYDHRSNISFVTTSSTLINSFIMSGSLAGSTNSDKVNDFNKDKPADKKIIVEGFPKNDDGTFKDGTPVSGDNTTLRYYKGTGESGDILDVKLYKQVGGTAENPIWEATEWTPAAVDAFHGGTVAPEMRGTYKLEYEWKDPTGAIVQAQGQKKITISEPAYIVYHLNDGTTLDESAAGTDDYDICAIDPGDYRVGETINSDPAAGHVLHKLDPNYTITGHNEYYWSTTRQTQPVVAQSDNEITTQADYVAKEFTEASALHAGRNDVYAAWIPNPHDVTIQKSTDPADGNVDPADVPQFNYGDKVLDKLDEIGAPEKVDNPPDQKPIGWQISYTAPDPDNPGETKTITEVVTPDTTMPDADVTIIPLWGISPSLTKSVVNNTHPGQENNVGDELTYTITATNNGPQSTWKDVTITDALPAGVTFMPDSIKLFKNSTIAENGSNDLYTNDNHTLAWNVGNIGYQETYTITFNVKINSDAITVGNDDAAKAKRDIANTAQVTDSKNSNDEPADKDKPITTDPVTPNPDKVADPKDPWPVTPFDPEPSIEKKVTNDTDPEGYLQVGDRLTYDIEVENKKPDSVWKGVVVKDTLPEGVDIVPGTIELVKPDGTVVPLPDTAYDPETRTVKVEVGSISGNDPEPYHITFKVDINEKPITGNPEDKPIGSAPEAEGTMPHGEEADIAVNDPVYPEYLDDTNVYWADPYSEVTKTAQNMSRDTAPTHVGDTVRYILTAENTKANSLWKDVVFFDKIPQGLEIDSSSIALVDPEGKTHSVSAQAYDAKTRILAVYVGDLLANQKATLSFEVKVVEAALNKDIGNVGMAKGGTDVPNGSWVEAGPYSVGDGYHPQGGGEQIPEGVIATGAVYPFPEDNINEFFDGHRGGVVNVDGSPATSDFTFALAGGVGVLTLAALATVVYTRRKINMKV